MAVYDTWTPAEEQRLRDLITAGVLTYSQMTAHFTGRTKNMLIGKAKRIGLGGTRNPGRIAGATKAKAVALTKEAPTPKPELPPMVAADFAKVETAVMAEAAAPKPAEVHPAGRVTLEQLEWFHCRWPFGSRAPFVFCGCRKEAGKSYCEDHAKAATQKSKKGARKWVPPKVSAFKFRSAS